MKYLLDTNVVSELTRPGPDAQVRGWIDAVPEDDLFLSVITIAEVRRGIASLPEGRRRHALDEWLRLALIDRFHGRIIEIGLDIAELWGWLAARAKTEGSGFATLDGFLAATAIRHELVLATRNTRDFAHLPVKLVDPWQPSSRTEPSS